MCTNWFVLKPPKSGCFFESDPDNVHAFTKGHYATVFLVVFFLPNRVPKTGVCRVSLGRMGPQLSGEKEVNTARKKVAQCGP